MEKNTIPNEIITNHMSVMIFLRFLPRLKESLSVINTSRFMDADIMTSHTMLQ